MAGIKTIVPNTVGLKVGFLSGQHNYKQCSSSLKKGIYQFGNERLGRDVRMALERNAQLVQIDLAMRISAFTTQSAVK